MSSDGSVTLTWADGEYKFVTRLGEWREIQKNCDSGLIEIMDRLQTRRWRVDDVREPIRVGLIGGGLTPGHALGLVKRYVDARPLSESVLPAMAILMAAVVGVPEDPADGVREKKEEESHREADGTADSSFQESTGPVPSSDSPHVKSTA